uniref:Anaphase-promoting complex subunit 10 n=1 Tax=Panagrolaimus davidi TaxID=227884 RepID=A0A914Q358_9BILA
MRNEKSNEASKKWQALISGGEFRDITFEACWTLSSCKAEGYGISQLLNPRIENYWQSDGGQLSVYPTQMNVNTSIHVHGITTFHDFKQLTLLYK